MPSSPLTDRRSTGFGSFLAVCVLMGLTNGMGSGINMTLGADFAHDADPAKFMSLWRLIGDLGGTVGPNGIGVIAQVLTLSSRSPAPINGAMHKRLRKKSKSIHFETTAALPRRE